MGKLKEATMARAGEKSNLSETLKEQKLLSTKYKKFVEKCRKHN